jgi:hypothetical protein
MTVRHVMFSKRVDRGPMQMVQHHVINSPERQKKNNIHNKDTCNHTYINTSIIKRLVTLFAADSPSSRPNGLFFFFFFFLHAVPGLCWASTAYPPFSQAGWARPCPPPLNRFCFPWIQATARFHVVHNDT